MKHPNEMSEIEQIDYVKKHYKNILNIKNPTEKVQLTAVKQKTWAIRYIKNPTEKVQIYVVNKNSGYIQDIIKNLGRNPSKAVQKAAIKSKSNRLKKSYNQKSIANIINPTLNIQKCSLKYSLNVIIKYFEYIDINHIYIKNFYIRKPKYKNLMKWID